MKRYLILLIAFVAASWATVAQNESTATVGEEVFTVVEQDPEFPGGMDALVQFLGSNVRYPQDARDEGVEGRVFVTFVVERDGSVSNVRVVRDPDPKGRLGQEAVRVVKAMPKWKPGRQRGKKVRVQFNLPIQFQLN